jgi:hypothetical protein
MLAILSIIERVNFANHTHFEFLNKKEDSALSQVSFEILPVIYIPLIRSILGKLPPSFS